jgi:allophanate hydrolase
MEKILRELSLDIVSLHEAYSSGTTVEKVLDQVFEKLAEVNDPGIFICLADEAELSEAVASLGAFDLESKPLWGIPFAVKDNIDVYGMPTTAACKEFSYMPSTDATVVRLLKEAGAIVIGKTNLDQFATGLVGVRTPYPIPRNAIDQKLIPGGSSSGSAVAASHGIVSFALGTDTAGSGRVPAGLNNIVGLKPTVGAVSTAGVIPACKSLDCVSIFALTVSDAHKVFEVVARPDQADSYSRSFEFGKLSEPSGSLSIGVPKASDLRFDGDLAMQAGYVKALETLEGMGHKLVELAFVDFFRTADLLYEGAWVAERYAAIQEFMDKNEKAMHPVTAKIIGGGKNLSAVDAFRGSYALQELKAKLSPVIDSVDMICVPTAPRHFTLEEVLAEPIATNTMLGSYTNFVNLLDLCGIAVPVAKRHDGLPMSVTLLAKAGEDAVVASLAAKLHQQSGLSLGATSWPMPDFSPLVNFLGPAEIELVVVGAHLSGMPLNTDLVKAGGKFLRSIRTTSDYRLFVLPGQTIAKPGLVRVEKDAGASIEVEVWSLPERQFARFVSAIPAPLGIGTIQLEDGSTPKGFLVESIAVQEAQDISQFGGWRNYVNQLVG